MVKNAKLKENARAQLGGSIFHSKWLTMLIICVIPTALSAIAIQLYVIGAIGVFVVMGAVMYGTARIMTKNVKGESWRFEEIICGFKENFIKTLLLYLLQVVLLILWSLLFFIPGIIKMYAYSMAFYLQQEPGGLEKEPTQLLAESRDMMKGYKWKLFCLDLSFIGWYILGCLCFGIGVFFVQAYHQQARANFYLARCAENGVDYA